MRSNRAKFWRLTTVSATGRIRCAAVEGVAYATCLYNRRIDITITYIDIGLFPQRTLYLVLIVYTA